MIESFDNITLKTATLEELGKLNFIYNEACEYFKFDPKHEITPPKVYITEGALPPGGVRDNFETLSCYVEDKLNGYICFYKGFPNQDIVYIAFAYLANSIKHQGNGKKIINYLSTYFKENGYNYIRLSVSLKNWEGLRFWKACGFNKLITVDCEGSLVNNDYGCIELEKDIQM